MPSSKIRYNCLSAHVSDLVRRQEELRKLEEQRSVDMQHRLEIRYLTIYLATLQMHTGQKLFYCMYPKNQKRRKSNLDTASEMSWRFSSIPVFEPGIEKGETLDNMAVYGGSVHLQRRRSV